MSSIPIKNNKKRKFEEAGNERNSDGRKDLAPEMKKKMKVPTLEKGNNQAEKRREGKKVSFTDLESIETINVITEGTSDELTDSSSKLNNKQLKKLKQKRKVQKKKKGIKKQQQQQEGEKNGLVTGTSMKDEAKKRRDFASDLSEYLDRWQRHQSLPSDQSDWKFNKVLQEWALQHCFEKTMISSELFKKLIPYLLTVEGKARERFLERLLHEMNKTDPSPPPPPPPVESSENQQNTELLLLSIAKKRALRLWKLLESQSRT